MNALTSPFRHTPSYLHVKPSERAVLVCEHLYETASFRDALAFVFFEQLAVC
jgi:hypothetical protein